MEMIIDKKNIVEELHRLSGHFGVKLSLPELLSSTADDDAKIDSLLSSSLLELLDILSPYAVLDNKENTADYRLTMPVNWKSDREESLKAFCINFLVYSLFSRWLDFVKNDSAALYRALNKENIAAINHILSLREKPLR